MKETYTEELKRRQRWQRRKTIFATLLTLLVLLITLRGCALITLGIGYDLYTHLTPAEPTPTPAPTPTPPSNTITVNSNSDKWEICYLHTAPNGGQSRHCPCVGTRLCLLYKPPQETLTILWRNHNHDQYQGVVVDYQTHITLP